MRISLVIPVFNQILATFGQWGCLLQNAGNWNNIELIVVDNGSTDGTERLLKQFITHRVPHKHYVKMPENVGYTKGVNVGIELAKGDIICTMHNDLFVYEPGWCDLIPDLYDKYPNVGVMGFVGAMTALADGGRAGVISNLLDAEQHGARFAGHTPVVLFDSLCLIARKEFWRATGGLDAEYGPNHWGDKDISLRSLSEGFTNLCVAAHCYHPGSTTANSQEYKEWAVDDNKIYEKGKERYLAKWGHMLPRSL